MPRRMAHTRPAWRSPDLGPRLPGGCSSSAPQQAAANRIRNPTRKEFASLLDHEPRGIGSSLIAIANRCLEEGASGALEAKIYGAVLGVLDANALNSAFAIEARASGMVLVRTKRLMGWVDAPYLHGGSELG